MTAEQEYKYTRVRMMTAEQEYIITEEELSRLEGQAEAKYDCDPSEVCENVRSRSYTAPLTQAPCGSNPGECIIKMDILIDFWM